MAETGVSVFFGPEGQDLKFLKGNQELAYIVSTLLTFLGIV